MNILFPLNNVDYVIESLISSPNNQGDTITVPAEIDSFPLQALDGISDKSKLILPNHIKSFGGFVYGTDIENILINCKSSCLFSFRKMLKLKTVTFNQRVELGQNSFLQCPKIEIINFNNGIKNISHQAFNGCPMLKKLILNGAEYISRDFYFDCNNLEYIEFPKTAHIEKHTSFNGKFRYICFDVKSKNYILCKNIPNTLDNSSATIIDLRVFNLAFGNDFCLSDIMQNENQLREIYKFAKELIKKDLSKSHNLLLKLIEHKKINVFLKNCNFMFFKNEISKIHKDYAIITSIKENASSVPGCYGFMSFAYALGCFSNEHLKDKNGRNLPGYIAQKACTFLSTFLSTYKLIPHYGILDLFENRCFEINPSQALLEYILVQDNEKQFKRLKSVIDFDILHDGFLYFFVSNFDIISQNRTIIYNGKLKKLSIFDAGVYHFSALQYSSVSKENENLAKLFMMKGVSEDGFYEALDVIKEANDNEIPEHILGKKISEKEIETKVYGIKLSVNQRRDKAKKYLIKAYALNFTFEMLSKKDDRNLIIGTYTSCCANIDSEFYGKSIATKAVSAPDVQNLVVKDKNGNIVGKGTIYVNKKDQYAVINEFDIDQKYRKHEAKECGIYNVPEDSYEEIERDAIFYAFLRGIYAFVAEYNKENPNNPLLQVNVGMGNNKLKLQCTKYMCQSYPLYVPEDYRFDDADTEQHILYCQDVETLID